MAPRLLLVLACVGVVAAAAVTGAASGTASAVAVDAGVLRDTANGRTGHFLVVLRRQADVEAAVAATDDWDEQGLRAVRALHRAASHQEGVERELRRRGATFRSYWIVDALAVEGSRAVVDALAARDDVQAIETDGAFRGTRGESSHAASAQPQGVEWNVDKIGAPAVWRLGDTGQNVVYANADTGVQWDHASLRLHYRGWSGSAATHDGNWWDAIHGDVDGDGRSVCGFSSKVPCDDFGHGTHVMGTAVGDDGAGNQIGVAPGAKWIGCRNMDNGTGRPSTYIECLQFFLAPTDLSGANPDPSKRPNVVGNSYSCPPEEGCMAGSLQAAIDNMRAAGVFMSIAAGNEGRAGCSSIADPPGIYDSAVTIGATDVNDVIAPFSSRGPVAVDGSGRRKPDLSAPGVNVRSAWLGGYRVASGTSMATPHVAAAVALLWSAFPNLRGNVDRTEQLLEQTAVKLTSADGCGGDAGSLSPNNVYGFGRIDVLAAYRAAEADSPAALSVADVAVAEGAGGAKTVEVKVTLSRGSTQPVTVQFATSDRTAKAGSDYRAASGSLTFASGETTKTIGVQVLGDKQVERDEAFTVTLSAPANATLSRAQATVTITNDDRDATKPVLSRLTLTPAALRGGAHAVLRYSLSETATTTFTLTRGSRALAAFTRSGHSGRNSLGFTASASGKKLAPGRYRLSAVPRDAAGNVGRAAQVRFTILG